MKRRKTGILGETLARDFLEKRGYVIQESNYRCPEGEIDIVARDGDYLAFVEVRTKQSHQFGSPEESITTIKKARLIASAYHYQQNHENLPASWRIDFLAVELDSTGKPYRMELFENAVTEP